jgi:hypothetical protein
VVPVSADVIVALGGGITADGEPQPATVARARRAAGLYRSGRAQRIVMSGAALRLTAAETSTQPPAGNHGSSSKPFASGHSPPWTIAEEMPAASPG